MKKLLNIICLITAIVLSSNRYDDQKTIALQATGTNLSSALLKQSADIISNRLKYYGVLSAQVSILPEKGQLSITLPANMENAVPDNLLTAKGNVAFYETYTQNEIKDLLKADNKLFGILSIEGDSRQSDPRVGCTGPENRGKTDTFLHSGLNLKDCVLAWSREDEGKICLFALKTKDGHPLISEKDIESVNVVSVSDGAAIHINLIPAARSVFADATRNNMNKSIAIVIDGNVYSWPVIKSSIEGGQIEVTGNFSDQEVKYLPAVFKSGQLPLEFTLMK